MSPEPPGSFGYAIKSLQQLYLDLERLTAERDQWYSVCDKAWTALDETALAEPDTSLPRAVLKLRERAENAEVSRDALQQQVKAIHDRFKTLHAEMLVSAKQDHEDFEHESAFTTEQWARELLAGLSETRGNHAESATCASCETLRGELQIKDAAVEGAIRRAERAEAKNAGRIDGDLGYGWICQFCGVAKDEGQQTGVYWYRKPVCGECAPKLSAMRLEHLGEDDHGRSK